MKKWKNEQIKERTDMLTIEQTTEWRNERTQVQASECTNEQTAKRTN